MLHVATIWNRVCFLLSIISWQQRVQVWNSTGKISYWSLIGCCTAPWKFSRTTRPPPPKLQLCDVLFSLPYPSRLYSPECTFFFFARYSRTFNLWFESWGTMERIINPFQRLAYLLYPVHHNPANSNACIRTTIPSFPTLPPPLPGWNFFLLSVQKFFCCFTFSG